MSIVRIRQCDLPPITEETIERLREAAKRPHVYDPENPPTPPEILKRNTMLRKKYNTRRITKEILIAEGLLRHPDK